MHSIAVVAGFLAARCATSLTCTYGCDIERERRA
jgi:hypothetical protein